MHGEPFSRVDSAEARADADLLALLESVDDGVFVLDDAGRLLCMSRSFEQRLGPAALGRALGEWIAPGSRTEYLQQLGELTHARGSSVRLRLSLRDAENAWLDLRLTRGRFRGAAATFGVARDVTDYEAAQLSYRAQDQKFRALCKSLPDGVFFLGPSGKFAEANEAASRQHGYGPGELLNLPIQQIAARPDFDFEELITRLRERGQLQYETVNRRKDGSVFPIALSLALIEDHGDADFMVAGVARDLSATKQIESELRETRDLFSALFATAPDALFIYEVDGTILDCNRAAEELFARTRAELLGRSVDALGIAGEKADTSQSAPAHVGAAWRMTGPEPYHIVRADGSSVDIEARSVPLQVAGKTMMLGTMQDVSRRLTAERARQRLEQQLHQASKMEAVGRLAGGIAHDFNNLLTVVAGYAELLLRDQPVGSTLAQGLNEILLASMRASGLTTQLLAFSRKQIIEPHVLDLNVLLGNATRMIERLIGEDVGLFFRPARELYRVKVDPNQIEQLLINLAVNARDAMPSGGVLKIRTENVSLREADLIDQPDGLPGDYVRLSVEDNGAGMSQETMGRLFEPFYTTKERGRGTGLGLSIIYGVVKQNGGFITVRSELGRGSRFDIHLPRVSEVPSVVTLHKELGPVPTGHGLVLLVEDEEAVRDVTARFLRNAGYEVITASRASEALALTEAAEPLAIDVLVTDVVLPELNGRQLYQRLLQKRPTLRAVFISGYTDEVIAQHGVVEPDISFLEKPFTQDALARKVYEALTRDKTRGG